MREAAVFLDKASDRAGGSYIAALEAIEEKWERDPESDVWTGWAVEIKLAAENKPKPAILIGCPIWGEVKEI